MIAAELLSLGYVDHVIHASQADLDKDIYSVTLYPVVKMQSVMVQNHDIILLRLQVDMSKIILGDMRL